MTTATSPAATRLREALPLSLVRELEGVLSGRHPPPAERPASIKEALIRWLNEEL
jgi:hypothetical protein